MKGYGISLAVVVACAPNIAAQAPQADPGAELTRRVEQLARQGRTADALDAYDASRKAGAADDKALLALIARGELTVLGKDSEDLQVQAGALGRLAALGDQAARTTLVGLASGERTLMPAGLAADSVLARLGDQKAIIRLGERAQSNEIREKSAVIAAIAAADLEQLTFAIVPLLESESPATRADAASALGTLGSLRAAETLSRLRGALLDPVSIVRMSAAVSLKRLGSDAGDETVAAMMKSGVPDLQLMAVRAYVGSKDRSWVPTVRPLLADSSPLTRIRAAEALLTIDVEPARAVLLRGLRDENPVVRSEAARVLELDAAGMPGELRQLLRDRSPAVRMYAASAILARSTPAADAR